MGAAIDNRGTRSGAGSAARGDIPTWCSTTIARTDWPHHQSRRELSSHLCAHALVVLKYAGPNDFYVLTSYPECR